MPTYGELGITAGDLASLRRAAQGARRANHSPYSGFMVLAAVQTDGGVFGGTNVENVNFTLTKHAEEVAILSALLAGGATTKPLFGALYVTGGSPCGSCRQFLAEFSGPETVVLVDRIPKSAVREGELAGLGEDRIEAWRLGDLLPAAFDAGELTDGNT
jgi:cytidine deaminase